MAPKPDKFPAPTRTGKEYHKLPKPDAVPVASKARQKSINNRGFERGKSRSHSGWSTRRVDGQHGPATQGHKSDIRQNSISASNHGQEPRKSSRANWRPVPADCKNKEKLGNFCQYYVECDCVRCEPKNRTVFVKGLKPFYQPWEKVPILKQFFGDYGHIEECYFSSYRSRDFSAFVW